MDWYCAIWNSDKVNNDMGAQILYEKICKNETNLVCDSESIEEFYDEITNKSYLIRADKGEGYVIISCEFNDAEEISDLVQDLAKKYKLSFYDPQNIYYINFNR